MNLEVQIAHAPDAILYSENAQPFVILNLIGNYFLLTRASKKQPLEKNINFKVGDREFYSTFLRHVNLSYAGKLSQLVEIVTSSNNPALQHQWLILYEIHDFVPQGLTSYHIGVPPYGREVRVHLRDQKHVRAHISNLFKLGGEAFYFLSCETDLWEEFSLITDPASSIIYGITYRIKDLIVCLPFHSISSEKVCPINICTSIKPQLSGTCYVCYNGNYCTGFVVDAGTVVSARHILPFEDQKVGVQVSVRFYPYHQEKNGYVARVGQDNIDLIVIAITDRLLVKRQTSEVQPRKCLPPGGLDKLRGDIGNLIGEPIIALGFGKFPFSPRLFHRVEIAMPSIETGIVSKVIKLGDQNVFIKTDAVLYNGFSGCGIWQGETLIGMAIFILKNKTNHSNFNNHNFSYHMQFILELLEKNNDEEMFSDLNWELKNFDKIQTRHKLALLPKL